MIFQAALCHHVQLLTNLVEADDGNNQFQQ
jgi:hypothetical protein